MKNSHKYFFAVLIVLVLIIPAKNASARTIFDNGPYTGAVNANNVGSEFYVYSNEYTASSTYSPGGMSIFLGKTGGFVASLSIADARLVDETTGSQWEWTDTTPPSQSLHQEIWSRKQDYFSPSGGDALIHSGDRFYTIGIGYASTYDWSYAGEFQSIDGTQGGLWCQIYDALGNPAASPFYAKISNLSTSSTTLYQSASVTGTPLETFPQDWIVQVASTTDSSGNPIIADGFQWYQVTNLGDGVTGWMKAGDASGTVAYLPYDSSNQSNFEGTSSESITSTTTRASLISNIVDYYYNNTSTSSSLYSSNDKSGYQISRLKTEGDSYPETLVLGIIAHESGDIIDGGNFDNENITSDFGHGIMQITLNPYGEHQFDNRGIISGVTLPQCTGKNSSLYENCYTDPDGTSPYYRHYKEDTLITGNPTFKQYSNTIQSMYANIKDGMGILSWWYDYYNYITTSATANSVTYSADERKDILATDSFNAGYIVSNGCGYVGLVADKLDEINKYFSNATSSDIADVVEKMHDASNDAVCANLDSPGDLSIQDLHGNVAGVVNGQGINTFPLAEYDASKKYVHILGAEDTDNYKYVVTGTANATYGLDVTIKNGTQEAVFHAKDIPTKVGEIHTYHINKAALLAGQKNAVTIDIQAQNGIDRGIISAGPVITGTEFSAAMPALEQLTSSSTENTSSPGNSFTAGTTTDSDLNI